MEYKSRKFAMIINEVLKKEKPLLATVHRRYAERFRGMGKLYVLTTENREKIKDEVVRELKTLLSFKD